MGLPDADSAEHGVPSSNLVITAAVCLMPREVPGGPRLIGGAAIRIRRGTRTFAIYGCDQVVEQYFCSYEVNPEYRAPLEAAGLIVSGVSEGDEVRVAELTGHPFFLATLFQPQLSSTPANPHPLITALLNAAQASGSEHSSS